MWVEFGKCFEGVCEIVIYKILKEKVKSGGDKYLRKWLEA